MTIAEQRPSRWGHPGSTRAVERPKPRTSRQPSPWPLEVQAERAARLQQSLLPDLTGPLGHYRLASLYRPCEALGGDFYDLHRNGKRAVLMVSDVMGHGIEAALTTMLLKAVFQEAAAACPGPVALLTEMDGRLRGMVAPGVFAAASVATLDLTGPRVRYANAGLPYPFLLRAGSRRVEKIRLGGLPLGIDGVGERGWSEIELDLGPGDVVLIASDGLGAVPGDGDECFEDSRLCQVLADAADRDGRKVISELMEAALRFGNSRPAPDDINLVAITRRGARRRQ